MPATYPPYYPPFGSSLPNRSWSDANRGYRFGFNGKEKDTETASDNFDFGARIYDGRLGRWLSVDPLMKNYPWQSVGIYYKNSPISVMDFAGMGDEEDAHFEENSIDKLNFNNLYENHVYDDEKPEDMESENDGRPMRGIVHKVKYKVRNRIFIQNNNVINQNSQFKFKVRGRNEVRVFFNANSQPDQLIITRKRWLFFNSTVLNTGMMIGTSTNYLRRGRYKVVVIAGPPSTAYSINISGQLLLKKEKHKIKGQWKFEKKKGNWKNDYVCRQNKEKTKTGGKDYSNTY